MWTWFGLAVLALIGEELTGTFYLLLVSLGLAAGGIVAWMSFSTEWQLLTFGIVTLAALFVLRKTKVLKKRSEIDTHSNADVYLDIGQVVMVDAWAPDRSAKISYRGAAWQADLAEGEPLEPGQHVITAVRGNRLLLARKRA